MNERNKILNEKRVDIAISRCEDVLRDYTVGPFVTIAEFGETKKETGIREISDIANYGYADTEKSHKFFIINPERFKDFYFAQDNIKDSVHKLFDKVVIHADKNVVAQNTPEFSIADITKIFNMNDSRNRDDFDLYIANRREISKEDYLELLKITIDITEEINANIMAITELKEQVSDELEFKGDIDFYETNLKEYLADAYQRIQKIIFPYMEKDTGNIIYNDYVAGDSAQEKDSIYLSEIADNVLGDEVSPDREICSDNFDEKENIKTKSEGIEER